MPRHFASPRRASLPCRTRRTGCNLAALAALGLLGTLAGAPGAATAAAAGAVLPPGTLPVLRGLVSDYSQSATFSVVPQAGGAGSTLTINQLLPKIILDWNSFNIANGSKVEFIQPSSSAAALNRIYDKDPSIIQGQIKANGQIYLVNQNGILFDRGTQIDVNTLVASSLNISDSVFQSGMTTGGLFTPAFAGGYDDTGRAVANPTPGGQVLVGAYGPAGAPVPKINAASGGAVLIIAPVIDNRSGVITSPDGQVILAAGNSAYLGFTATNDPGLRGMLVEVTAPAGQDVDLSSYVRNAGSLSADRGNVTLAGLAINQQGRVSANSAMLTNGSIYLQARTLGNAQRGSVTLGADSVTETPLDTTDTTTLRQSDDWTVYRPVVKVQGATIDVEGRITSPSGAISFDALDPVDKAAARIYLAPGSLVDASGVWSEASDASNLLTFKVTSNELKNSPDQKSGVLRGATVTVDLRAGSTLLDLSGYQANQARTLAQKAAQGGVVTFTTSGDLIERTDATVNVSGGGVHYTGATESTSKLVGADGRLYDISTAPEGLRYVMVADTYVDTQARWGYSETFSNLLMGTSLRRPDFNQGSAGGGVSITMGPAIDGLVLDGALLGGATVGSQQLANAPSGGSLNIGLFDAIKPTQEFGIGDVFFLPGTRSSLPAGFTVDTALSDERRSQLLLSTDLFAPGKPTASGDYATTGFGSLVVNADGRITVPEGVTLAGPLGGALTLRANQIEVDGHIAVAAGSVTASTVVTSGTALSAPSDSGVVVARGAGIDTRGAWTNNFLTGLSAGLPSAVTGATGTLSTVANGGSISLSGPVVTLAPGSTLDVSAGGQVSARGIASGGAAGSITLNASAVDEAQPLTLGGTLLGEGFGTGGTLSVTVGSGLRVGSGVDSSYGLNLDPSIFSTGGFRAYQFSALGDVVVTTGSVFFPKQESLQIDNTAAQLLPTGADVTAAADRLVLPDDKRKPVSLSLASTAGALRLEAGAGLGTDPGATVSLSAVTGLTIDGTVFAPSGTINVSLKAADLPGPTPVLELGAKGILSTHAVFTARPSDVGLVQGTLGNGGTVALTAQKAEIRLDAGSIVDVAGTRATVDLPAAPGANVPYTRVVQTSNAGTLSITADDRVTLDGAFHAGAENAAAGGSFALTLTERGDFTDSDSGRRIVVTQSGTPQATSDAFKDVAISVDKLVGGGFDKIRLTAEDQIDFATDTTMNFARGVTLDTKLVQVADGADVKVSGATVKLADSFGLRVPRSPGDPSDPRTVNDPLQAPLRQPTLPGSGSFTAIGDTIDLFGNVTIGGTRYESLQAVHDLRLSGRTLGAPTSTQGASLVGELTTAGNLTIAAAQIYPTTASAFTIAVADGLTRETIPGTQLEITRSSGTAGSVYSAGGSLTLAADSLYQRGVVKAPLGTLALEATSELMLGPQSVTSVSADGLIVPYGETQAGVTWTYAATGSDPFTHALATPPSKRIALNAPAIDMLTGARVDVSGGGDVQAVEFVPGSGGTTNALIQPNTYAIIPAAQLSSAPIDPDIALSQNLGFDKDNAVYNSIRIGPGGTVPAGDYVLLPGYYGLLKGGYVVQLLPGSTYANLQPGQTASLQNGLTVVPGVMTAAGTDVASATTIGVVVRPGSDIPKLADYTVTSSSFFTAQADRNHVAEPRLPSDGGQLSISATQRLTLDGTLQADLPGAGSRSAEVDIAADRIALVDRVGRGDIGADYLQIDATSLSRLDASLLIGGVRSTAASGLIVTPTSSDIVVANTATTALKAPELILAATDGITVRSGSRIESSDTHAGPVEDFSIGGPGAASGAVVRVASSGLATIQRPAVADTRGTVTIEAGATLASSGSLTIDATRTTTSHGDLQVTAGGALALVSGSLSLGETDGVDGLSGGLVLDNAQLAGFNSLSTLSLKSYQGIDLYGQANIGSAELQNLVIDGAALVGHASAGHAAQATISGQRVSLLDTAGGSGSAVPTPGDAGGLTIAAGQITVGAGDKRVSGYASVALVAGGEIVAAGQGSLQSAAPLTLQAARIDSLSGADQAWSAVDLSGAEPVYRTVSVIGTTPSAALPESTALGSRLQITGSRIDDSGWIAMKSGAVTLAAAGTDGGDVRLSAGALVDVGGTTKDFQGTTAVADAGRLDLVSQSGAVRVDGGATLDLSAAAAGGHAGRLSITAGTLALAGTVRAHSAQGVQGSVAVDLGTLADFSALNAALDGAGFAEARDIRVRSGDLVVAAGDVVQAHHVVLESDSGLLDVHGRIDASAPQGGGSIALYGAAVTLRDGAVLDASGTSTAVDAGTNVAAYANGGEVSVVALSGTLTMDAGALIDVRAGAKGSAGRVLLRAPRLGDSLDANLAGTVLGQRNAGDAQAQVVIEGNRLYGPETTGARITQTMIDGYAADNQAWMSGIDAAAIVARLRGDDGLALTQAQVRPAVQVQAAGDLAIVDGWNLTAAGWINPVTGGGTVAGSLQVQAAGTLTLASASVGNPDASLVAGPTWNIALTSGADLGAADASRTQSDRQLAAQVAQGRAGAGDLMLDSQDAEASIRTGTGQVRLSAGRDFVVRAGVDAETGLARVGVVTTSGVAALRDPLTQARDSRFTTGGGDIAITAGRDAVGAGNEWMTEWYRTATDLDLGFVNGNWWAYRPNFHDGVAAFGGGHVSLVAGRDIQGLSAYVPTSALKVGSGDAAGLAVFGGGDLTVRAGNDIVGGQYLVGRGNATLDAGGDLGGQGRPSQLFIMGASGDPALAGATATLVAGGAVTLSTIDNPSSLSQTQALSDVPSFNGGNALPIMTLSSRSSVSVSAKGGDLRIGNRPVANLTLNPDDQGLVETEIATREGTSALPPQARFTAFGGDIVYTGTVGGMTLFPSTASGAKVLAAGGIDALTLGVSDTDPARFAYASIPEDVPTYYSDLLTLSAASRNRIVSTDSADRFVNDVVALGGSIDGVQLKFPARSRIWAADDIFDPTLTLQNLLPGDLTEVVANAGSLTMVQNNSWGLGGPGTLLVQAGRNLELGRAPLASFGNQHNQSLRDASGGDIVAVAGLIGAPDLSRRDKSFADLIVAGGQKNPEAAKAAMDSFFASAVVASGNIDAYNTSIQSYAGGNIDLIAPGGNITVGLTTPNQSRLIGVVTNAGGAIRSYLSGDFDINQGKVLTAQGGDILIYTRDGSIDAGRGAKTSVTTPPPIRTPQFDSNGNVVGYTYTLPVAVAGSGIQTATSKPNGPTSIAPPAGNIYLFAPSGTIDAGEAGIASGGNIFIAALTVLNGDNISSAGTSVGVPQVQAGSVASTVAASGATTAAGSPKDADAATQAAAAAAQAATTVFKPAILTVEVLGFGERNCKEQDKDCFAK